MATGILLFAQLGVHFHIMRYMPGSFTFETMVLGNGVRKPVKGLESVEIRPWSTLSGMHFFK